MIAFVHAMPLDYTFGKFTRRRVTPAATSNGRRILVLTARTQSQQLAEFGHNRPRFLPIHLGVDFRRHRRRVPEDYCRTS